MSAIDLTQFHATFFAESREGLDAMEAGLLGIEAGQADDQTINTIFRAAHSIKGGSSTFGFQAIAETTHLLETLLDDVRGGKRSADDAITDALLASVDVLRGMLDRAEAGEVDGTGDATLNARLAALLATAPVVAASAPASAASQAVTGWRIRFEPKSGMYASGNDPLRILRELASLGPLRSTCLLETLPALAALDAGVAYIGWTIELDGVASRAQIDDVFSWVEDECVLELEPVHDSATEPVATEVTAAAKSSAPSPRDGEKSAEHGDSSIRVAVAKVDALINLVGELVITQAMLKQQSALLDPAIHDQLLTGLGQLDRNTHDLQEAVMSVRMLPVEFVFSRFPRLVRDLAGKLGKKVRLRTTGEGTELDKGVIEHIVDPLTHLIRNSVDHGLETPEQRAENGKDPIGTVTLSAAHQGGHIILEVGDDGRGLDRARILAKAAERGLAVGDAMSDSEVWQLIFHPGLSTADKLTDVSGRGVGMDVVKQNISALGGEVHVESRAGTGTRITIKLPLTLAILDAMTIAVGTEIFVLPLGYVVESLQPLGPDIKRIGGQGRLLRVRGEYIPLVSMATLYGVPLPERSQHGATVVVVESAGQKLALEIDELIGQQQVVVKSIESNYRRVHGISGATILGDGRVALIVDVSSIARAA